MPHPIKGALPVHRIVIALASCMAVLGIGQTPAQASHTRGVLYGQTSSRQLASAYSPEQIETAYDFAPLYSQGIDGTGQIVALVETDGLRRQDLHQFDQTYNLADPSIKEYYVGGHRFKTEKSGETVLDVEWLHALAPGATIQIYYMKNTQSPQANWKSMAAALRAAATNHARSISISLGACGPSRGFTATKSALAAVTKRGISVFVASGDDGDHPGPARDCGSLPGVGYPSSDPSVVAVGGTSLDLNEDNTIANEVAWSSSGGGRESLFQRAVWQVAPQLPSDTYRWVPDVAFLGDPHTGVSVYFKNRWHQAGGTSLGAPAWAAVWALVQENAQRADTTVGAAPALLYGVGNSPAYARTFHEITSGSNGRYSAGPGWNAVTGWGTPDVANLVATILAMSSAP